MNISMSTGVDLDSSLEILNRLKSVCDKNLLVVLTLQTPVEEVLQLFNMVVILYEKQVSRPAFPFFNALFVTQNKCQYASGQHGKP